MTVNICYAHNADISTINGFLLIHGFGCYLLFSRVLFLTNPRGNLFKWSRANNWDQCVHSDGEFSVSVKFQNLIKMLCHTLTQGNKPTKQNIMLF